MRRAGLWPDDSLRPGARIDVGDLLLNFYEAEFPSIETLLTAEGAPPPDAGTSRPWRLSETQAIQT